jgi:hypothetical protein
MARQLTDDDRKAFGVFADHLIPAYKRMPAATAVGVHGALLDAVLGFRPDIAEDFFRGLDAVRGKSPADAADALFAADQKAFDTLGLVASAAYYMAPEVRDLVGYPGQESLTYNPHESPDYLTDGMLERVVRRGPIYRPTGG